jgi:broad specificity phosphatase PhoE
MKWPNEVMLIRHDTSEYNILKDKKKIDKVYQKFLEAWKQNPDSTKTRRLALVVKNKYNLKCGDAKTKLADEEGKKAYETGMGLSKTCDLPDVIFVSPYDRTKKTLHCLTKGWKGLEKVKVFEEERIREQEHGIANLYNDWKVFLTLHPDQRKLQEIERLYWYRFPQGESVPDVRERIRSFMSTLTRDWNGKNVLLVTHHLSILAFRAHMDRLSAEEFIDLDNNDKPINCGVTLYRGYPKLGKNGQLKLEYYNRRFY